LGATCKSGKIIGNRFRRVVHDLADLGSGFALEREPDDLSAMRQDRPQVIECAAHADQHTRVSLRHDDEVSGNGSRSDEEDAVSEVFCREQCALPEVLLTKVENLGLTNARGTTIVKQDVVDRASMEGQANGLFVAVGHGLPAGSLAATASSEIFPGADSAAVVERKGKYSSLTTPDGSTRFLSS
jgi:hypothetical protein